ncbi:PPP4R2-domain-containing protein [Gongronella butleri]|nr:PPP4R2-domain-containing protein [Gongronella butleri]
MTDNQDSAAAAPVDTASVSDVVFPQVDENKVDIEDIGLTTAAGAPGTPVGPHLSEEPTMTILASPARPDPYKFGDLLTNLECDLRIVYIAHTNEPRADWETLKPLIKTSFLAQCDLMEKHINDPTIAAPIIASKSNIVASIDQHTGMPFTIQRLCELIMQPDQHYQSFIKYLHAIEKVLSVTSNWDDFTEQPPSNNSAQQMNTYLFSHDLPETKFTPIEGEDDEDTEMADANGHDANDDKDKDDDKDEMDDADSKSDADDTNQQPNGVTHD